MQLISEPYTYLLIAIITVILAYRVIVALAFGILASKLRGRFGVSKKEMAYIVIASFFDTVLGIFILAISALTKEGDPRKARRIISRMKEDGSRVLNTLGGIQDPSIVNLSKDVELFVQKLSQVEEDPQLGSEEAIDILEKMEAELLYIRDKADDISVETDQRARAKVVALCEKRTKVLSELMRKLLATLS